ERHAVRRAVPAKIPQRLACIVDVLRPASAEKKLLTLTTDDSGHVDAICRRIFATVMQDSHIAIPVDGIGFFLHGSSATEALHRGAIGPQESLRELCVSREPDNVAETVDPASPCDRIGVIAAEVVKRAGSGVGTCRIPSKGVGRAGKSS